MKFLFACGGTAGHVNPAIAVAGRLRELMPDCEILFAGAEGKMEMELVPREGYEIRALPVSNLSREHSLEGLAHNVKALENVAVSMHRTDRLLKEFKPDAVIGTGGYVCYPVLRQAARHGIPTLVHESNAVPGLTTKLLDGHIDCVMVGFEESRAQYKDPEKVIVTGTPVRGDFNNYTRDSARDQLGIPRDKPLVVSVWGSLGAGDINKVILQMIPLLREKADFRMIHSVGTRYYEDFSAKLQETAPDCADYGVDVRDYIYDMPRVMAAADLILCRAGASTLSELTYIGKPALLIPSPNVTNNHPEKNARVLEKAGGAKVLLEGEFDAASLLDTVRKLLCDRERLESMSRAMASLAVPDATERIVGEILSLVH